MPQKEQDSDPTGTATSPTSTSLKWYRITDVPPSVTKEDLEAAIRSLGSTLEGVNFVLELYPSLDSDLQTALLQFDVVPKYFQNLKDDGPNYARVSLGCIRNGTSNQKATTITLDSTFYDLTQLNNPTEKVDADVIAVTGLGGHAYGSWRNRESENMWLHDFLPNRFKNVRIMTYGYDSKLAGEPKTQNRLLDYKRHFINMIKNARSSELETKRPIIFIGHSLGAILIVEALIANKELVDATQCIMFFGAPHKGLDTSDLEIMADAVRGPWGHTRGDLVKNLRADAERLEDRLESFVGVLERRGRELRIISFYEQSLTRKFVMTPSGPKLSQETTMRANILSSQLYMPHEEKIGVQENHTDMVKFGSASDPTYRIVTRVIGECLAKIKSAEAKRNECTYRRQYMILCILVLSLSVCIIIDPFELWRAHGDISTNRQLLHTHPPAVQGPLAHTNKGSDSESETVSEGRAVSNVPIHFSVPFSRNERYIGRSTKHASIRDALSGNQTSGHRRLALWGLGGVGKTQDVLDYVYELSGGQLSVFWIYAGSKARFEQDYRSLAVLLQLPGHDNMKTDIRPAVKAWFQSPASGDWILVLDNADNILDFYPESEVTSEDHSGHGLAQFIPQGPRGTVIVTTRDYRLADKLADMNILEKRQMNPDEAMQLFTDRYPNAAEDQRLVSLLLEELEYLPLAIVQATAYLRQNRLLRPSGYLQQFRATKKNQRNLLSKRFSDLRRESSSGSAGEETILATFAITFEQIRSQWPLAGSFLEIMACIDRQGIPMDLFHQSMPEDADVNASGEALGKLMDFALITTTAIGEDASFVMHALVHVSVQEFIFTRENMPAAMQKTGKILLRILPDGEHENWSVWKTYLPHVLAWMENKPVTSEDTATIYYQMSWYLRSIGQYNEAEDKVKISATMQTSCVGAEHPSTLASMSSLASTYSNQGRWTEAKNLGVTVVEKMKRVLGPEHPSTLASMASLAVAYRNQGRWTEAEKLGVAVMKARKKVLGFEHLDTLRSMSNLALTYSNQGRWTEAKELQMTVLQTRKRVLGLEHPDTLTSILNLASTYQNQGQWAEAEKLQITILETMKSVLGVEHPDTLSNINNLAVTYSNQERWIEAEELGVSVLDMRERVLGLEHPDTLASMNNLALTYYKQGRLTEAEKLQIAVMETRKRVFGLEHMSTLTIMSNLAVTYSNQGKWTEAKKLQMAVLEKMKMVFGAEHPRTLASMKALAYTLHSLGRTEDAIAMMKNAHIELSN